MNTMPKIVFAGILALGICPSGWATMIARWDFSSLTNGSGNYGPSPMSATTNDANVIIGGLLRGAGVQQSGTGAGKGWGGTHFNAASQADAIASNDFATFSVTINGGYTVSLTNIAAYNIRHSGTGPTNGIWQFNINGGDFTDIGTALGWGTDTSSTGNNLGAIPLGGIAGLQNLTGGTVVGFRIVSWSASSSSGSWYFNDQVSGTKDLVVNGTVTAGVPAPTVAITNPANNAKFTLGSAIQVDVTATDAGSVSNVAFYADGVFRANAPTAPYGWTWNGAAAGAHALKAVAWNNSGLSSTSAVVSLSVSAQGTFAAGNLVVYRVGDGVTNPLASGSPVFLDEYSKSGILMQSFAMPTNAAAGNFPLIAGNSGTEGLLTLSLNGRSLVLTGYGTTAGGASLSGTTAGSVPRVVGVVSYDGLVDTSTALGDFASGSNPRSVVSSDGTNIWVAGGAGGVRYTTKGSTNSVQLNSGLTNIRQVNSFGGQLYVSTQSGASRLNAVGSGMPTNAGQAMTVLAGFPTNGSANAFFIADLTNDGTNDTLYVADESAGIQKYTLAGGSWNTNGVVASIAGAYFGVTGYVTGTNVDLFVTSASKLDHITDTSGYNGAFSGAPSTLVSASSNTAFRGVAPTPSAPPPPKGTILMFF